MDAFACLRVRAVRLFDMCTSKECTKLNKTERWNDRREVNGVECAVLGLSPRTRHEHLTVNNWIQLFGTNMPSTSQIVAASMTILLLWLADLWKWLLLSVLAAETQS